MLAFTGKVVMVVSTECLAASGSRMHLLQCMAPCRVEEAEGQTAESYLQWGTWPFGPSSQEFRCES